MTMAHLRHLTRTLLIANLIRLVLLQRILSLHRCSVSRTALQILRNIKRKRVHREWATKKKWRRSRKLTWRKVFVSWCQKERKEFNDKMVKNMMPALVLYMKVAQDHRDQIKCSE